MKQKIYLIAGVPGSGKSWLCEQLKDKFEYIRNDDFMEPKGAYVRELLKRAPMATMPVLCEAPFSVSAIKEPLEAKGFEVISIFIWATPDELYERWDGRGKASPKPSVRAGHLSRQETYRQRAWELGAFCGTSSQALEFLTSV